MARIAREEANNKEKFGQFSFWFVMAKAAWSQPLLIKSKHVYK